MVQLSGTSILVSDLAKIATQERSLMDQSRELLSTLASMHVSSTICSVHFLFISNYYSNSNLHLSIMTNRSNSAAYKGSGYRQLTGGSSTRS
jgi:hypothetical protein